MSQGQEAGRPKRQAAFVRPPRKANAARGPSLHVSHSQDPEKLKKKTPFVLQLYKDSTPRKVTPSLYAQEISQTTEERLANTNEVYPPPIVELLDMGVTANNKFSLVDVDQALFQPYPSEVFFQNFTPAQTYKLPLLLFNNDKVSRHVKLEHRDSDYFSIVGPEDAKIKVAPGLSATFTVVFTPQEDKDYHHMLVFRTDRERFEVPVHAIGARAILNFRDELNFPGCPVKASTQKTQFISNIGKSKAVFSLLTQRPFSVTPCSGSVEVGEGMQITVDFNPMTTGEHRGDLLLRYHTGEDVYIRLHGTSEELNVNLQPGHLTLKKTYLTFSNLHTVSLTNTSDVILNYRWRTCQQEEEPRLRREGSALKRKKEAAALSGGIQPAKDHLLVVSQSCITVEPVDGEVWPKMTANFCIVFKPEEAKIYRQTIYCDVTGRESLIPLTMEGEGLGPMLQLNYSLWEMKNVFIRDKDRYEVLMTNTGLIDAPFRLSSPNTTFGRCFSFSPQEGVVPVDACQSVEVTFHCPILGSFSEDLLLTVGGQPQPLTLTFRGCVIAPTCHFSVSELNFGDVAFGFPQTLSCKLLNTSFVPMRFALRVLGDGRGSPSGTSLEQVSEMSRNNWQGGPEAEPLRRPVEFSVSPAAGCVRAMSDVIIKVTLCSNTVKKYSVSLVVDVEGVGEEILELPVNARCVVPEVVVDTPVLDFQRCFLNYRYEERVRLTNTSPVPACYGVLDQEVEESPSLVFGSSKPRGLIFPHSSEELPVSLEAKVAGKLHQTLRIAVFGSVHLPLEVVLRCIGQGPIVHVHSRKLDFGKIPVLTDFTKALRLSNQSPIPACFTARMSQRRSQWRVEPTEGEVPPQDQLELMVVAHLKDTLSFQDKLEMSIQDSQKHVISLLATGTGTTIVSDKPLAPSLDLGTQLSRHIYQYHFKLTNHGQRAHQLYWVNGGYLTSVKARKRGKSFLPPIVAPKKRAGPGRGVLAPTNPDRAPTNPDRPLFGIIPPCVELLPGQSADLVLQGMSDTSRVVNERLVCRGILGSQTCFERIMSVDVTCRFEPSVLKISPKQLKFFLEEVPGKSLDPMYEKLVLKNVSSFSLPVELCLSPPFSLCEAKGVHSTATSKYIVLAYAEQVEVWVCFNPSTRRERVSQVVDEFLEVVCKGYPQQDTVELHAEVHFPNLYFSTTTVDFGCVLNNTESSSEIIITNCSQLPVSYCWAWQEHLRNGVTRETELLREEAEYGRASTASSSLSVARSQALGERAVTKCSVGVENFDVLPVSGVVQPSEEQAVTFYFYGHSNASSEAVALCQVAEGPSYEVKVRGEASEINYSLDNNAIDFGLQLFDQIGTGQLILRNTGKMGFKFRIKHHYEEEEEDGVENAEEQIPSPEENVQEREDGETREKCREVRAGRPTVIPAKGYVNAGAEQCLQVLYIHGIPEKFEKCCQLVVAHHPPQDITLTGEGVFPRIGLDLPRNWEEESAIMQRAKATVVEAGVSEKDEELFRTEMEQALVREHALAVSGSLLQPRDTNDPFKKWQKLSKFMLPEYFLDFVYVVPGMVCNQTVTITNIGSVPVSFFANCKPLTGTGFTVKCDRVKDLPCGETQSFSVKFDPLLDDLPLGEISVIMPIQVTRGPVLPLRLRAVVTMPTITLSTEKLQFDVVQCGTCQIRTIQLSNQEAVPCTWSIAEEIKTVRKVDKFLPLYMQKKILQKQLSPPVVFEVLPYFGTLSSGERFNIRIKFTPVEACEYNRQLIVSVAQSTQQVSITALGQGEEPHLEFCPLRLELGPSLPFSYDVEAEVRVKNPCSFPIEFFSLDFDKQYPTEEKIMSLMQGYDKKNAMLLPPRNPGENLPAELLEYYNEQYSQLNENAEAAESNSQMMDSKELEKTEKTTLEWIQLFFSELTDERASGRLDQMELTPASKALARHMGVFLTPEGQAARNRRGIAIIVYGAPQTDKSRAAASLASHYGAALLSLDAVVSSMLLNSSSNISVPARQMCERAAAEQTQKKTEETAPAPKDPAIAAAAAAALLESSAPAPNPAPMEAHVKGGGGKNDTEVVQEAENTCIALTLGIDKTKLNTLFSEQILSDILAERLQMSDCHPGIVFDGLESVFTQSVASTLQVILKAFNNRKHIYVVNLYDSYFSLKARERAQKEADEALQKEKIDRENRWLHDMDEEAYDDLPEEKKEWITQQLRDQRLRVRERKLKEEEEEKKKKKQQHEEETSGLTEEELKMNEKAKIEAAEECAMGYLENLQSSEDELQCLFSAYEQNQIQVDYILQQWDRTQGLLLQKGENPIRLGNVQPDFRNPIGGKKAKKSSAKVVPLPSQVAPPPEVEKPGEKGTVPGIVPHIIVKRTSKDYPSVPDMIKENSMPLLEEILDELGLGPNSPRIPPPITFQIIPFPKVRVQSEAKITPGCFFFLDPSIVQCPSPPMRVAKQTKRSEQEQHLAKLEIKRNQRLTNFRWVVPAGDEVILKIWFYSESPGNFEEFFNFEIVGIQKQYQLLCQGLCGYPSFCTDYMTLFSHSKKVPKMEEGLQKTYVITPGYYEFGPLLCSKTRDRYKENDHPENTEKIVIQNTSGLEIEVHFRFQHDTKAYTYLMDPLIMILQPYQAQDLTVWAFPTKLGQTKDSIVCCVKDNPEVFFINLSCWGVQPELELESKNLQFDKILLARWATRTLTLHNKTSLPVSWRLQGLEELGDDFSVPVDEGVLAPKTSIPLEVHFRSRKQYTIQRGLRLEISDVDKILGVVHVERIRLNAEAYDISLQITPEGCLDFGTIKVLEEAELFFKMENLGKYKFAYKFTLERTNRHQPNLDSIFTVSPKSGTLVNNKNPTKVRIVCKTKTEVSIKEQPILRCQVIEPNLGDGGETVALLDIKISIQSTFARYLITPPHCVIIGPLVYGCKKSQNFTIENKGIYSFSFNITSKKTDIIPAVRPGVLGPTKKAPTESVVKTAGVGYKVSAESCQPAKQNRITFGPFSVSPCTGTLHEGTMQVVNIDFAGEHLGEFTQDLLLDITDRDYVTYPEGIPFVLMAEVCKPGIVSDVTSVFEEHQLCQSSSQLLAEQLGHSKGVYIIDEDRFIFPKVLVGRTTQARFKLTNNSKVVCELSMSVRMVATEPPSCGTAFHLSPPSVTIPSQSHAHVTVTFTPLKVQVYSAIFEALLDGLSRMRHAVQNKVLEFELVGEGSLPSVSVLRPSMCTRKGSPVLQFRQVLVGRRRTLPLVLLNDGNFLAQVHIDMPDKYGVFSLKAAADNKCGAINFTQVKGTESEHHLVHRASLMLNAHEQVQFEVSFCSDKQLSAKSKMLVLVDNNPSSNTIIRMSGEAYWEVISLEPMQERDQEEDETVLNFGDCHIDRTYQESMIMTNHSNNKVMRFEWPPAGTHIIFAPQVGHLHAGCSKEMVVTFSSSQPVNLNRQSAKCKVVQVEFQQPLEEVCDWDDQKKAVEWLSTMEQDSSEQSQEVIRTKVIKTEPEPPCSVVEGSQLELELRIVVVCDFVKFSCNTDNIRFEDTMIYQNRLHQMQIVNQSSVKLDFSWTLVMNPPKINQQKELSKVEKGSWPCSKSVGSVSVDRTNSPVSSVTRLLKRNPELPPFTVEPSIGTIIPGTTKTFNVCFSPLELAKFEGKLLCSIPNLRDGDRAPCVSLCGRGRLPHCHFDLPDSDYLTGNRRNPEFSGHLDPDTKILEFSAVGLFVPTKRCFNVLNPTAEPLSFHWKCVDSGGATSFTCLTPSGTIQPGKQVEVRFKYIAEHLDAVESSWSFVIEYLSVSIPFLCVGVVKEPLDDLGELLVETVIRKKRRDRRVSRRREARRK